MGIKRGMVAVALALAGCASHGGAGATTGAVQSTDGGAKAGEHCGAAATCGTGTKTYQSCTTAVGNSCSERFLTSDGQSFACASCTDCADAASMVTSWCGGSTGNSDASCAKLADNTSCIDCCTNNHKTGNDFLNSALEDCECNNPGDCSIECDASLCQGNSPDSQCDQCVQESISFGDCDETTACMGNADCAKLLDCSNACPP